jgi:hypothetical protein
MILTIVFKHIQNTLRAIFNGDDIDLCICCDSLGVADDLIEHSLHMLLGVTVALGTVLLLVDANHVVGDGLARQG